MMVAYPDISMLEGKFIQQIRYGLYQLQLCFNEPSILIEIGHKISFNDKRKVSVWQGVNGRAFFCMNEILDIPLLQCYFTEDGDLILLFVNEMFLRIHKDVSALGESYLIWDRDKLLYVAW